MIDLRDYIDPVSIEKPLWSHIPETSRLSHNIQINTDNNILNKPEDSGLAIIGVPDDRRSPNKGCAEAPDAVRAELYQLSRIPGRQKITDLGNIKKGVGFDDTLTALTDVCSQLLEQGVIPLIIGGSSSLNLALNRALMLTGERYSVASVDSRIDWVNESREHDAYNYLPLILKNNKQLLNFVNIGYQTYLNDPQVLNRLKKKNCDLIRIGEVRNDIQEVEPLFRDSDLISFDISAVRQSDAPGSWAPSSNGFYGEEICLLSRYAGLSDRLKICGFFETNPLLDSRKITVNLQAQMLWFFIEGHSQKQNEYAALGKENSGRFVNYHVSIKDSTEELVFVKSTMTNRWWIVLLDNKGRKQYIACSYKDYLQASENEVPKRWMKAISMNF